MGGHKKVNEIGFNGLAAMQMVAHLAAQTKIASRLRGYLLYILGGPSVTYNVALQIGGSPVVLRCGMLPDLLGMTLMLAGTQGIIGTQLLHKRLVGYFPRRRELVL